jgi:hypothetical protein
LKKLVAYWTAQFFFCGFFYLAEVSGPTPTALFMTPSVIAMMPARALGLRALIVIPVYRIVWVRIFLARGAYLV